MLDCECDACVCRGWRESERVREDQGQSGGGAVSMSGRVRRHTRRGAPTVSCKRVALRLFLPVSPLLSQPRISLSLTQHHRRSSCSYRRRWNCSALLSPASVSSTSLSTVSLNIVQSTISAVCAFTTYQLCTFAYLLLCSLFLLNSFHLYSSFPVFFGFSLAPLHRIRLRTATSVCGHSVRITFEKGGIKEFHR